MHAFGLALALLAATPQPRSAQGAKFAAFIPHLERVGTLVAFSNQAGQRASLLSLSTWAPELNPLVPVDLSSSEALQAVGIDPAGDLTVSELDHGSVSCLTLSKPDAFEKRAHQTLSSWGTVAHHSRKGVQQVTAEESGQIVGGYALKGRVACAFEARAHGDAVLKDATDRAQSPVSAATWQRALSLRGDVFLKDEHAAWALRVQGSALTAELKSTRLPVPTLGGPPQGTFAAVAPSGLIFLRARFAPGATRDLVRMALSQLQSLCPQCGAQALSAAAEGLSPLLTGQVIARVDRMQVKGALATLPQQYFSLRNAWVAEVRDEERARALMSALGNLKGAEPSGDGFRFNVPYGTLWLGVHNSSVYLANDAQALAALLAPNGPALPAAHGMELALDPKLGAKALAQASLLDILSSPAMAGLFAVGTELGPLLGSTEHVEAWLDSDPAGGHRGALTWTLR